MLKVEGHRRILQKHNICAIIITYHPDINFSERAARISCQVDKLAIVDNSSNPSALARLKDLSNKLNANLIMNNHNFGVATALNQGVQWAIQQGYEWVLLLDQDSEPTDSMVDILIEVHDNFSEKDKIAVIGSNYYSQSIQKPMLDMKSDLPSSRRAKKMFVLNDVVNNDLWSEARVVITSGSLISAIAYQTIGSFRDEFFIDHVDDEYCLRARSKGFKVIFALKPGLKHSLGQGTEHKLLGKASVTSNHASIRRYYMTRNYLVLLRKYLLQDFTFFQITFLVKLKAIMLMIFFENHRYNKLRFLVLGILDGIFLKFDRRI